MVSSSRTYSQSGLPGVTSGSHGVFAISLKKAVLFIFFLLICYITSVMIYHLQSETSWAYNEETYYEHNLLALETDNSSHNEQQKDANYSFLSLTGLEERGKSVEKQLSNDDLVKLNREDMFQYMSNYWEGITNSTYYTNPVTQLPLQNNSIIVFTGFRSGSSFFGQLFNQHPDVFYIYEPLLPFGFNCSQYQSLKMEYLHRYAKCDFPSMFDLFGHLMEPLPKTEMAMQCLYNRICFRHKMKKICRREYCNIPKRPCSNCGPVNIPIAMNQCRAKKMSVIKVIRVCDILDLKSISNDPDLNIKIIHLVRDPRGIQSSRLKVEPDDRLKMIKDTQITCDYLRHNSLRGKSTLMEDKWLKDRYLAIRYEDLAMKPMKVAKKVYKFANLKFPLSVKKWITQNTRSSHVADDPYATTRNSAAAMQTWRSHLNFSQVETIQNICSEVMTAFGYRRTSSENELKNMKLNLVRGKPWNR